MTVIQRLRPFALSGPRRARLRAISAFWLSLGVVGCDEAGSGEENLPSSQYWSGGQCQVATVRPVRFEPVGVASVACVNAPAAPADFTQSAGKGYCGTGVFSDIAGAHVSCPSSQPFTCRPPTGGQVSYSLYQAASPCYTLDSDAQAACSLTGGCVTCGGGSPSPQNDSGELAPDSCSIAVELLGEVVTTATVTVTLHQVSGPEVRRWLFSKPSLTASFAADAKGNLVLQVSPPFTSDLGFGDAANTGASFTLNLDGIPGDAPNPRYTSSRLSGEVRVTAGMPPLPSMNAVGGSKGASSGNGSSTSSGWGSGSGWRGPLGGGRSASRSGWSSSSAPCSDSGRSCTTDTMDSAVLSWRSICMMEREISGCHCEAWATSRCFVNHECYAEAGAPTSITREYLMNHMMEEEMKAVALGREEGCQSGVP